MISIPGTNIILTAATNQDRQAIYKIRHNIYAAELNQHSLNDTNTLTDDLDAVNHYIVAKYKNEFAGFISVTPPATKKYSVDKYFSRSAIPFLHYEQLFEIRLLTVVKESRNSPLAFALMYAAFRWVQSHGGKYIVAICRQDLIDMYRKAGLRPLGVSAISGKVTYELSVATTDELQQKVQDNPGLYRALKNKVDWQLSYTFFEPSDCYHGGAFFKSIGEDLTSLQKAKDIINADVLDAWFPPSPKVLELLQNNLPFLLQTSPPTHANGLIQVIAAARGVKGNCLLPGAGSSDLIFLGLRTLLHKSSKVLILDPTYGEYIHVLEKIIGCTVTRFNLHREDGFVVQTERLLEEIFVGYDMVIMVNPNSPTGVYISKTDMQQMLTRVPNSTLVWIDETYIDFVGPGNSLEQLAVSRENVIICKSMSKAYSLSGVRSAYLCSPPHLIENLRSLTPPWAVSLPAQAAAIAALKDREYYEQRYAETHLLRESLKQGLLEIGITEIIDGVANFLLFYLPEELMTAGEFIENCKMQNLFLRDVSNMGSTLGKNAIRIAVKDAVTNGRMLDIMKMVLFGLR